MHSGDETDEEVMARYQLGSEEAFAVLYERHSKKVFGFVLNRVRDRERAAEVFQEVFVKMHRSKHLYNRTLPVLPWLFSISRSVVIDAIRADLRSCSKESELAETLGLVDTNRADQAFELASVKAQIARLPDHQRVAVEMRYVDERTFEEIAKALSTSPVNVRQLISRGVRRLKELVREGEKP